MALATVNSLTYAYPGSERAALRDVSLSLQPGEVVAILGPSGSGKSTLLRALSGLVPHFHGGRFVGRVEVAGADTRVTAPAALAGTVATLFQDPEDQVVFDRVRNEVAFGLENIGIASSLIAGRIEEALAALGAEHLADRRTTELSSGELQRVCLAATLALRPQLLLLDEPTSQLDPEAAEAFLQTACGGDATVVVSEQRPSLPLALCHRVLFVDEGRIVLDAPRDAAVEWLEANRPDYAPTETHELPSSNEELECVCRLADVGFAYAGGPPVVEAFDFDLCRGEVVALIGPNGVGKTTVGKLAAGLLRPGRGRIERVGRAAYLSQDPGRYLVRDRADDEVALGAGGDVERARRALAQVGLAGAAARHPRDLSSGERERLALAAVLVTDPDVLVLDEPTRGVDPKRKTELARLLRADAHRRGTLLITHDLVFAADAADRATSLDVRALTHA